MKKFLFLSGHAHLALDPLAQEASGGAELQVALLSKELVARGYNVVLLGAETSQEDGVIWEGVRVRVAKRFDTGLFWDTCWAIPAALSVLSQEKPDVVVVYGWTAWLYLLAKWRFSFSYRLVFICALDSEVEGKFSYTHRLKAWLFQRGMRFCDVRFGITEYQQRLFQEQGMRCSLTRLLLLPKKPVRLLSKLVDVDEMTRASGAQNVSVTPIPETSSIGATPQFAATVELRKKSIDLLWVARCNSVKQPLLFLELAERLPQLRCQMICSKQDEELWNQVVHAAQQLNNVLFLEKVPYRKIQEYFDHSKIFVNTSIEEGVPNTFIHAGLGHTAIASLRVDPDHMFDHFQAGFCAENNKELFIENIQKFLCDETLLSLAQAESARFVATWHCNEKNVDAFLKGIDE